MTRCDMAETRGCSNDADRRVVWDMIVDYPELMHLCEECRREYDAAVIDDLGPTDPRDIPAEHRSRTLNRFIEKINWDGVDDAVEDCWEWTRSTTSGYAQFRWSGGVGYGHRYSFQRFWDIDPPEKTEDVELLHECSTKKCANPAHLWLGTRSQNVTHAIETGQIETGSAINEREREEIRARYDDEDETTQADLADEYGHATSVICEIINGKYVDAR